MQGVGGGIFPLCFGIIRDEFPRERVARSDRPALRDSRRSAAASASSLGGLVVDHVSYHWIFWLGAIMGLRRRGRRRSCSCRSRRSARPGRVDVRGAVVLGVGLVLPLIAISQAHIWGWGARADARADRGRARRARGLGRARAADAEQPLADISTLRRSRRC